jgi:CheY-like chemotaxis protein/nitrogen-specific signal transduction histidine kinase
MTAESLLQALELFPGPALIVRPAGEVVGVNDRMERWIGMTRDELRGRPLAQVVADPPERLAGFLGDCARGGSRVAGTLRPSRGEGAGGECRVEAISVSTGPNGDAPSLVVIHVAPDGPGGRGGTVESLREEVRRRDEFLHRLAHDLRNSAAAISGALDLARTATLREDVVWAEDTMERQIKHLVRQIDDLLDVSRIARGKIQLARRRLDAAAVARAAAAAVRPLIDERGHRLTLSLSPGELAVDADPARLEQILVGLIGHVAGSTGPGGHVRCSVARERDDIVFRVRGDATDIPRATSDRAPDRPAAGERSEGEQGLGLILVRKLAELHGGSVRVGGEEPGRGSELILRLPAAVGASESRPEPPSGPRPTPPAGSRVLVVDDNVDAARGTARLLQLAGHDVRVAHDGREALELARETCPQFVLLDIGLPVMDGYEVARQLRGDPRLRDAVIVAVSGYSQDDYRSPEEAGFDHHMVKPIDYDALRAVLNRPK